MRARVKRRPKYNAKKAVGSDGFKYDSQAECRYGEKLLALWKAGTIPLLLRQVPFFLPGGIRYRLDFMWIDPEGEVQFEDVKGMETEGFKIKKALVLDSYGIEIRCVKG